MLNLVQVAYFCCQASLNILEHPQFSLGAPLWVPFSAFAICANYKSTLVPLIDCTNYSSSTWRFPFYLQLLGGRKRFVVHRHKFVCTEVLAAPDRTRRACQTLTSNRYCHQLGSRCVMFKQCICIKFLRSFFEEKKLVRTSLQLDLIFRETLRFGSAALRAF